MSAVPVPLIGQYGAPRRAAVDETGRVPQQRVAVEIDLRAAVDDAVGSTRAEGLEVSREALDILERVVTRELSPSEATAAVLALHRQ